MFNRFIIAMLSAIIGATVATAITAVVAAVAFLMGVVVGSSTEDEKTEDTEK